MRVAETSPSHGDHMWDKGIIYLTYYIYLHINLTNYQKIIYNAFVICSHTKNKMKHTHEQIKEQLKVLYVDMQHL